MERIAGDDVAEDLFGAGKDGFTAGSPGIAAATVLTEKFLNELQEELVAGLIEHAGLTPGTTTTQLRTAIATYLAGNATFRAGTYPWTGAHSHAANLTLAEHLLMSGLKQIQLSPAKTREIYLPLSLGRPDASTSWTLGRTGRYWSTTGDSDKIEFPIIAPAGTTITRARVYCEIVGGTAGGNAIAEYGGQANPQTGGNFNALDSAQTSAATAAAYTIDVNSINDLVDMTANERMLVVTARIGTSFRIYGVQCAFSDTVLGPGL